MDAWTQLDDDWQRGYSQAERVEVAPVVDVRKFLHPKQREVFECDATAMNLLGGRQCGKTFTDVGWLIEGGLEQAGTTNPYFGLTGKSVTDIMWPEVSKLNLLELVLPRVPPRIPELHFREALELAFVRTGHDHRSEPDLAPAPV